MFQRFAIVAAASVMTVSCSAIQDTATAEQTVDRFHRSYNEGRYGELYTASTTDITGTVNAQGWNDLLAGLKNNFGNVRSAQRNSVNVNYNNGVSVVELTYDTEMERGRVNERFTFRMNGQQAQLMGYRYERTSGGSPAPAPAQSADQPAPADQPAGGEGDKPSQ